MCGKIGLFSYPVLCYVVVSFVEHLARQTASLHLEVLPRQRRDESVGYGVGEKRPGS